MKKRFMKVVKKYLVACVTGDNAERAYNLGWLQGVASAALWNDDIEAYEFYNEQIHEAISLSTVLCNEAYNKF